MELKQLVVVAVLFVITGFALAIGQIMLSSNASSTCSTNGFTPFDLGSRTWGNRTELSGINPVTNGYSGCCALVNATNASHCRVWDTGYTTNSSYNTQNGVNTLAYWLPTIALAIAAGFVISILVLYLLGSVGSVRGSSSV